MQTKHNLLPWWPENMPTHVRTERMDAFFRLIYPIWAPIQEEDMKRDQAAKSPAEYVSEVSTMHTCDNAIFAAGYKPDRVWETQRDKARQAGGAKFAKALGNRRWGGDE